MEDQDKQVKETRKQMLQELKENFVAGLIPEKIYNKKVQEVLELKLDQSTAYGRGIGPAASGRGKGSAAYGRGKRSAASGRGIGSVVGPGPVIPGLPFSLDLHLKDLITDYWKLTAYQDMLKANVITGEELCEEERWLSPEDPGRQLVEKCDEIIGEMHSIYSHGHARVKDPSVIGNKVEQLPIVYQRHLALTSSPFYPPLEHYYPTKPLEGTWIQTQLAPFYNEKQTRGSRCGLHALNNFVGRRVVDEYLALITGRRLQAAYIVCSTDQQARPNFVRTKGNDLEIEMAVIVALAILVGIDLTHFLPPKDPEQLLNTITHQNRILVGSGNHFWVFRKHSRTNWIEIDSMKEEQKVIGGDQQLLEVLRYCKIIVVENKGDASVVNELSNEHMTWVTVLEAMLQYEKEEKEREERNRTSPGSPMRKKVHPQVDSLLGLHQSPSQPVDPSLRSDAPHSSGKWSSSDFSKLYIRRDALKEAPDALKDTWRWIAHESTTIPGVLAYDMKQLEAMAPAMCRFILNKLKENNLHCLHPGIEYSIGDSRIRCSLGKDWEAHYTRLLTSTYKKVLILSGLSGDFQDSEVGKTEFLATEQTWRSAVYTDAEEIFYLDPDLAVETNSSIRPQRGKDARSDVILGVTGLPTTLRACATGRVQVAFCDVEEKKEALNRDESKLLCTMACRVRTARGLVEEEQIAHGGLVYPLSFGIVRGGSEIKFMMMWWNGKESGDQYEWLWLFKEPLDLRKPEDFIIYAGVMYRLKEYLLQLRALLKRKLEACVEAPLTTEPRSPLSDGAQQEKDESEEEKPDDTTDKEGSNDGTNSDSGGSGSSSFDDIMLRHQLKAACMFKRDRVGLCQTQQGQYVIMKRYTEREYFEKERRALHLLGHQGYTSGLRRCWPAECLLELEYDAHHTVRFIPVDMYQYHAYLLGLAKCLWCVHNSGIIHGDIKPDNILVKPLPDGRTVEVKLIDFDRSAMPGDPREEYYGTNGYYPPEWWSFRGVPDRVFPSVDIYSLGVVALAALVGADFAGEQALALSAVSVIHKQWRLEEMIDELSGLIREPPRAYHIQLQMLKFALPLLRATTQTDPEQRPTAKQIIDNLL